MINQDVITYIRNELSRGTSRDIIKKNLMGGGGWTSADVDFHFGLLGAETAPKIVPRPIPASAPPTETKPMQAAEPIMVRTETSKPSNLENLASLMTHSLGGEKNLLPTEPKRATDTLPVELQNFDTGQSVEIKPTVPPPPETVAPPTQNVTVASIQNSVPDAIKNIEQSPFVQTPTPSSVHPHKPFIFKVLLSLVLVLILGGGGAYGYYYYTNNNPEKIFARMANNLANIKSFEYKGSFLIKAEDVKQENFPDLPATSGTLTISQEGILDINDPSNISATQDTTFSIDFASLKGSLRLSTALLNHILYLQITQLPEILSAYIAPEKLAGKWFAIDAGTVKNAEDMYVSPEINTAISSVDQQKLDKIRESLKLHPLFKIDTNLGTDEVNGVKTYHYAATFDKENAKLLVPILSKLEQSSAVGRTPEEEQKYEQDILESIDAMEEVRGEIWIGQRDYLPYKIVGEIKIDNAKIKSSAVKSSGETTTRISITASKFNQKFDLVAPKESVPIMELISEFFGMPLDSNSEETLNEIPDKVSR